MSFVIVEWQIEDGVDCVLSFKQVPPDYVEPDGRVYDEPDDPVIWWRLMRRGARGSWQATWNGQVLKETYRTTPPSNETLWPVWMDMAARFAAANEWR